LGTTIWVTFLTFLGYKLGDHYELVDQYLGPVSKIVLAIIVISFILGVVRKQMRRSS
jgi:membrane protein DedA with SNARE-associated domain